MSIEAEPASLAGYSSLGSSSFPMDSSIAEISRRHAQRQCGRYGKNVEISGSIAWLFVIFESPEEIVRISRPPQLLEYSSNDNET